MTFIGRAIRIAERGARYRPADEREVYATEFTIAPKIFFCRRSMQSDGFSTHVLRALPLRSPSKCCNLSAGDDDHGAVNHNNLTSPPLLRDVGAAVLTTSFART
jgi:hypothetical protein